MEKKIGQMYEAVHDSKKFTPIRLGSFYFQFGKLLAQYYCTSPVKIWKISTRQNALAHEDAVMTTGEDGESRRYSEWVAHARAIAEQMWQRFHESRVDAEGDLDDNEAWTLIT